MRANAAAQDRRPDMSYILSATEELAKYIHKDMVIVLESTTYPGTTREVLLPLLTEQSGLKVGENVFVAFSPPNGSTPDGRTGPPSTHPKVIGGITEACSRSCPSLVLRRNRNHFPGELGRSG
jgi:UDP-N-acetyl-D-glucosamine dehydrogenase